MIIVTQELRLTKQPPEVTTFKMRYWGVYSAEKDSMEEKRERGRAWEITYWLPNAAERKSHSHAHFQKGKEV